ncbi:daunorubicin resistance protein DrrA family ABC transporter ATP-binding protein [Streptomyces albus]|uniref:ABC-type xenobiotic transporter n=1 Tax=Streptomyces albus TaxID=1888 RepID=A0A6C1BYF9_9ACTN|nr:MULTISPECIES: daunorubicin resistance protein DrrA family ABC transporter ATP-binding protein [Streptomyces]KPC65869.1 ABC transporter [Streptomyces sp. NRRL F-6602]EPD96830.1 daunorubicin resistance ABC transporter, ATP-binding protein [Streptomyces sp. HPH0547]MDI6412289.1 daunorubicin resistance protein DrrA family ABC transporter ATP-binding protein [Streptomyces albus]QID34941.1 daunorubicin resistance protein DrrA family ABC transporter ATP-binding protein [Streptomyces albus]TGG76223
MTYTIETRGLVKRFGEVTALDGLDLTARQGTVLGVLGPNGAGKTTAVRILASLLRPDEGSARVCGWDVARHPHEVRRLIGLTGQYASVDQDLTGQQNIVLVARLLGFSRSAARRRAAELLGRFGLTDAAGRKARTYSGGMRRRLDLAVCLVGDPSVLYLDEPTTGLDPESRSQLWDIVRGLVTGGTTVLLTTQYMDEADQLSDDIVVIDAGKSIATGTPEELKAKTDRQTLEIQPADPAQLETAGKLVAELSGTRPHVAGTQLRLHVNDLALPGAVLRRLDEAGIEVMELALRKPSLNEVFLSLTGHQNRHEDPATATTEAAGPAETAEPAEAAERSRT